MSNRTLVDEIITLIQSESNNNPPPKSCKIIGNYDDKPYSDVEVEELGKLTYKKTIGSTEIGLEGVICFLNGEINHGVVITPVNLEKYDFTLINQLLDDIKDNNLAKLDDIYIKSENEFIDKLDLTIQNLIGRV